MALLRALARSAATATTARSPLLVAGGALAAHGPHHRLAISALAYSYATQSRFISSTKVNAKAKVGTVGAGQGGRADKDKAKADAAKDKRAKEKERKEKEKLKRQQQRIKAKELREKEKEKKRQFSLPLRVTFGTRLCAENISKQTVRERERARALRLKAREDKKKSSTRTVLRPPKVPHNAWQIFFDEFIAVRPSAPLSNVAAL